MWNKFKKKNIWYHNNNIVWFKNIVKIIIVIISIIAVFWGMILAFSYIKKTINNSSIISTVSETIWKDMKVDKYGNINILMMGVGWSKHSWWWLADTIIVVSYNIENNNVSMISIPRDLYVRTSTFQGKINGVMANWYLRNNNDLDAWALTMLSKIEEVIWLDIPYYAIIDFEGFKKFIDDLWWLAINIPYSVYDTSYPKDWLDWYEIFSINPWYQILDWATTLKYARSRHSTSDFSRSERQQLILMAVKDQVLSNLTIDKVTDLYNNYKEVVTTNISMKEILWLYPNISNNPTIHSFWLTTECNFANYKYTPAGCTLIFGVREDFWGMSVILPMWASSSNIGFYDYIHNFVQIVGVDNAFLNENKSIVIKNGIDKSYANSLWYKHSGWANKIASKLSKFWFNIDWVDNSDEQYSKTAIYINWSWTNNTINTIDIFDRIGIPNSNIITWAILEQWDIEIILGNDYIDLIQKEPFNYNKIYTGKQLFN